MAPWGGVQPGSLWHGRRRRSAGSACVSLAAACALGAVRASGWGAAWLLASPAVDSTHGAAPEGESARGLLQRRQAGLGLATLLGATGVATEPAAAEQAPAGEGFGKLTATQFSKLTKAAGLVKSQNLKLSEESDLWGTIIDYHPEWLAEPKVGARVYANSGNALLNLGKPKKALFDHNQAIESDATCSRCYVYRGITLEALNRTDQAFADYVKATELEPGSAVAWVSKGQALMSQGKYAAAKEALLQGQTLFTTKPAQSPEDARLDAAVPWSGLPRGFIFSAVNLAVAEYEGGDETAGRQRIGNLLKAMSDKPLPAALAASALMLMADKGGTKSVVDFEAEAAWKKVEDVDYRWHKLPFASKSLAWGPKLTDALAALRANKYIAA